LQAFTTNPGNLGNADVLTFATRYYPFISSRAGFAYHGEYSIILAKGQLTRYLLQHRHKQLAVWLRL